MANMIATRHVLPCLILALSMSAGAAQEQSATVEAGKRISIEYTLTLNDGSVVDTNVGKEPLVYTQGEHQLLPAVEQALQGLHVNDSKQLTLSSDQAYGSVDPSAFTEVDLDLIPADGRYVGAVLQLQNEAGHSRPARVAELKDETAVLDLNHPLAGKALNFDIRILGIQ